MGGDDLASDDEYLFESGVIYPSTGRGTAVNSSDSDDGSDDETRGKEPQISSKNKRKAKDADAKKISLTSGGPPASKSKRRKKTNDSVAPSSSKNILIHAGRGIANDGAEAQAVFFGTLYNHFTKLSAGSDGNINANDDDDDSSNKNEKHEKKVVNAENFIFQSSNFFSSHAKEQQNDASSNFHSSNMATFLKSGPLPSMKRLKNWKHPNSPMVLVVTLSARRSVELMKQLSTLRLPIAKLFAKHMNIDDQVQLLSGGVGKKGLISGDGGGGKGKGNSPHKCYGIGVGTPGRLLALLNHGKNESSYGGALRLNHTELIVIDCHEDSKGFNVCTMKDTSKELMDFMKEGVVPELSERAGNMKLALF
mmetsp:Transcript_21464/g.45059  ORF Transcript_21464/g.45059 Transcript_21464/m.45059 type:complete len:365 (+) Transcript_21464:55-1149(+)